jgi:hypothetical protein
MRVRSLHDLFVTIRDKKGKGMNLCYVTDAVGVSGGRDVALLKHRESHGVEGCTPAALVLSQPAAVKRRT